MSENNTVSIGVVYQQKYEGGPFYFGASYEAGSLDRVIASLIAIRDSIPEEYRAVASCEFDSVTVHDCDYAQIEVSYRRPMTADEIAERERVRVESEQRRLARDKAEYERLQKLFGQSPEPPPDSA